MKRRRLIWTSGWLIVTIAALVWVLAGHLRTPAGLLVLFFVVLSIGFGTARLLALHRRDHEDLVQVRRGPYRASMAVGGLIMFGPLLAAAANWISIVPAWGCFLAGSLIIQVTTALFSDGYQGVWLDSLIFFGKLEPPDGYDHLFTKKR